MLLADSCNTKMVFHHRKDVGHHLRSTCSQDDHMRTCVSGAECLVESYILHKYFLQLVNLFSSLKGNMIIPLVEKKNRHMLNIANVFED